MLVEGLLIAFIWKYRRRKRPRFEDGAPVHGATRLELAWTAGPVIVLFVIAAFVFIELPGIKDIPDATAGQEQLEIKVTGRQFYWQYEYPNGVIAIDHMRAPVGRDRSARRECAGLRTSSTPGGSLRSAARSTRSPVGRTRRGSRPTSEGTYTGQCAELCGLEHARMLASVEVMSPAAFDAWLQQRRSEQDAGSGELGEEQWTGVCAKCHGMNGEGGIGPRIAGSPTLSDPAALATIVRNGRRTMPAVGSGWTDEQVAALAAYLKESPPSGQ